MFECECSGGENMEIFKIRGNGQSKKESKKEIWEWII